MSDLNSLYLFKFLLYISWYEDKSLNEQIKNLLEQKIHVNMQSDQIIFDEIFTCRFPF